MRVWPLVLVLATGCRQLLGFEPVAEVPGVDGSPDSPPPVCSTPSVECASDTVLRTCTVAGEQAADTPCPWGCLDGRTAPHCGALAPSGGTVVATDLDVDISLQALDITAATLINSDTGQIISLQGVLRPAGAGVASGIGFERRGTVGVFRVASLTVNAALVVSGTSAIAIVADGPITIDDVLDARPHGADGATCPQGGSSPGGFSGGGNQQDGDGPGGGRRGNGGAGGNAGGGGGGHGALGGDGGDGGNGRLGGPGGAVNGDLMITTLAGAGGSGGGGGGGQDGKGGAGGGAIQLVSNQAVRLLTKGGVNAGGCRGFEGDLSVGGGGGGGAGGAILIEAPVFEIGLGGAIVGLAVNGGGGGAGGASGSTNGTDALLAPMAAAGGTSATGVDGGDGGAITLAGAAGGDSANNNGGGGGGAVGRIRIHTRTGTFEIGALGFTSPSTNADPTTTTAGVATVE